MIYEYEFVNDLRIRMRTNLLTEISNETMSMQLFRDLPS
jgi:hypothetical protein